MVGRTDQPLVTSSIQPRPRRSQHAQHNRPFCHTRACPHLSSNLDCALCVWAVRDRRTPRPALCGATLGAHCRLRPTAALGPKNEGWMARVADWASNRRFHGNADLSDCAVRFVDEATGLELGRMPGATPAAGGGRGAGGGEGLTALPHSPPPQRGPQPGCGGGRSVAVSTPPWLPAPLGAGHRLVLVQADAWRAELERWSGSHDSGTQVGEGGRGRGVGGWAPTGGRERG